MRKFIPAVAVSAMLAVSASAFGAEELKGPVNLTFAAQEVGTAAYTYATALQTVMLKELPSGSKIAITTT